MVVFVVQHTKAFMCLQAHSSDKVIVYFLTCASVDFFHTALSQLPSTTSAKLFALHGKMKQAARESVMASYTSISAGDAFHICVLQL